MLRWRGGGAAVIVQLTVEKLRVQQLKNFGNWVHHCKECWTREIEIIRKLRDHFKV